MAMAAARLTSHFAAFWPFFSPSPGFRFVAGRGIHRRSCALGQGMAPSRTIAIHGGHWVGRVSGWHVGGTDPICLQPMVLVYKKLPATGWFWDFGQMLVCIFQHHGLHILEHMGLWKRNGHIREHIHEHIISTVDAIKCWSFWGKRMENKWQEWLAHEHGHICWREIYMNIMMNFNRFRGFPHKTSNKPTFDASIASKNDGIWRFSGGKTLF